MVRCDSGSDGRATALLSARLGHRLLEDASVRVSTGLVSVLEESSISN
jgi:hypothetical protein